MTNRGGQRRQIVKLAMALVASAAGTRAAAGVSLEVGCRWLDLDYSTGAGNQQFGYDVLTQGPIAGLAFRF